MPTRWNRAHLKRGFQCFINPTMESRSRRMTMRRGGSSALTIALLGLVLLTSLETVRGVPYKRALLRLCSRNLSDAVSLVCGDRGYNEPSAYTGEDSFPSGPGLAEECCLNTCTMAQLRQYCKPDSDAVKDSAWILDIPFPPIIGEGASDSEQESEKERSRLRSTGAPKSKSAELKCKSDRSSRVQNHGINNARVEDGDKRVTGGQPDLGRKSTYPRRRMRRPPGKRLLGRTLIAKLAPAYQRRGHEPLACSSRSARPLRLKRRKGIAVRKAGASSTK